jgi:RNA polymerase sigma-70 factor (family 1)
MMDIEDLQYAINKISLNDDQSSFEKIYTAYYNKLFRLSLSIVKSEEVAEEVYDDVMLNIWERRKQLSEINNFTVYLYVSIKNASLRYLSRSSKISNVDINDLTIEIEDMSPTAHEQLIALEFTDKINTTIANLSPQCKLVFKLVKEDGLKYKEVAEILDISIKNVEYHMGNALKKISNTISSDFKLFLTK